MSETSGHALGGLMEPVNRYIQDPIAKQIVGFLKNTPVTPNQVTYFSVLTGFASGYAFSFASSISLVLGGILLEMTLVLDCVDGQLARAKGMASEWGRLIDGIAGYFAYLAVVVGLINGFPEYESVLKIIAGLIILRAISYDYCKQSLGTLLLQGYDGMEREIQSTRQKIQAKMSWVLVLYFYYMQAQQLFFRGEWSFLRQTELGDQDMQADLTLEQRKAYYEKIKILLLLWRWNGLDLPLFLLSLFAVLGILSTSLIPFACVMAVQYLLTLMAHHYFVRRI
ncbi:MAG: CDP-alcohol phosphatidyltransferase family protein [Nitrospinae bacterium]|nr:CDP-alcohol phosphatidyltransferase family protein [Nitrospinota bacterium]MBL7019328.1 CDP-alcohol phosphatidyltransferase family protein [Nitrospinaceae bacterium]